jgi:hypothetical protein
MDSLDWLVGWGFGIFAFAFFAYWIYGIFTTTDFDPEKHAPKPKPKSAEPSWVFHVFWDLFKFALKWAFRVAFWFGFYLLFGYTITAWAIGGIIVANILYWMYCKHREGVRRDFEEALRSHAQNRSTI